MKTIIAVIFLVFAIIIGLTAIDTGKAYLDKELGLTSSKTSISEQLSSEEEKEMISVTLSGEVESPGTYEIEPGLFLEEVITLAGGITSKADTDCFDFYFTIQENLTIYIPPISEETIPSSEIAINVPDEIKQYKELLDSGAITQEEYDAKKKQLLEL